MKRVIVTGGNGQLGLALKEVAKGFNLDLVFKDKNELDITDAKAVNKIFFSDTFDVCINAAAYTDVDGAESNKDLAFAINATALETLAKVCKRHQCWLIHVSTDYVFDGQRAHAYVETDDTNPLSVYGRTKLEGDEAITNRAGPHLILRTGWIYESRGKNFVSTMLRLASSDGPIRVVNDQWGTPNRARELAKLRQKLLHQAIATGPAWWETHSGLYHVCAPDHTTWFNFAKDIIAKGHSKERAANVKPIPTSEFPTPARRPAWSVMSAMKLKATFGLELPGWRAQLNTMLAELQKGSSCS